MLVYIQQVLCCYNIPDYFLTLIYSCDNKMQDRIIVRNLHVGVTVLLGNGLLKKAEVGSDDVGNTIVLDNYVFFVIYFIFNTISAV